MLGRNVIRGAQYFEGRKLSIGFRILHGLRALLLSWTLIAEINALRGKKQSKNPLATKFLNDLTNATAGYGLNFFQKVIKLLRKRETLEFDRNRDKSWDKSKDLFANLGNKIEVIQKDLKFLGFAKLSGVLSESEALSLYKEVAEIEVVTDSGEKFSNLSSWLNINGIEPRVWTDQVKLGNLNAIKLIQGNPVLLKIARDYLGTKPILAATQSWTTKYIGEVNEESLAKSALAFHSDADYFKFVKFFLLLTKVTDDNGPFMFVQSSHLGPKQVTGRSHDSNIIYETDVILKGTGNPGDIVIADTSGWHKGSPVKEGSRTMIQLLFTSSLFGHPTV